LFAAKQLSWQLKDMNYTTIRIFSHAAGQLCSWSVLIILRSKATLPGGNIIPFSSRAANKEFDPTILVL